MYLLHSCTGAVHGVHSTERDSVGVPPRPCPLRVPWTVPHKTGIFLKRERLNKKVNKMTEGWGYSHKKTPFPFVSSMGASKKI